MNHRVWKRVLFVCWLVAISAVVYKYRKSPANTSSTTLTTGVVESIQAVNQATGWVTTNVDGLVIVHDRGARFNFVPAKSGTNDGGVTSGPASK